MSSYRVESARLELHLSLTDAPPVPLMPNADHKIITPEFATAVFTCDELERGLWEPQRVRLSGPRVLSDGPRIPLRIRGEWPRIQGERLSFAAPDVPDYVKTLVTDIHGYVRRMTR